MFLGLRTGVEPSDFQTEMAAFDAQSDAQAATLEVLAVRRNMEKLFMVTEALWTILKDEHGYDDELLLRMVAEIDLRDGKIDGRVAIAETPLCGKCNRPLGRSQNACLYCGEQTGFDPFGR